MGGDSEPPLRGSSRSSENPPPRCDVPSDKSKRDPDQKLKPGRILGPKFDAFVQVLVDQLRHQQQLFAELDSELEQEPDRERAPHTISQRSLDPDPRTAKKRPASVVEIKKVEATPDPAPDPMQLSKADDEDAAVEERRGLWSKAEKGIDLTNAHTRKLYQIGKTELNERLNAGDLTRAKRGYVTAASIKAHPPGFVDRKAR
jgi:hypothetical protein